MVRNIVALCSSLAALAMANAGLALQQEAAAVAVAHDGHMHLLRRRWIRYWSQAAPCALRSPALQSKNTSIKNVASSYHQKVEQIPWTYTCWDDRKEKRERTCYTTWKGVLAYVWPACCPAGAPLAPAALPLPPGRCDPPCAALGSGTCRPRPALWLPSDGMWVCERFCERCASGEAMPNAPLGRPPLGIEAPGAAQV